MTKPRIWTRPLEEMARTDLQACASLWSAVFPDVGDVDQVMARCRDLIGNLRYRACVIHGVHLDDRLVAAARSFVRTIATDAGDKRVLALAGVCTDPAYRLRGYAREVVSAAFARLDDRLQVCLFQTDVPAFYRRLGARPVANAVIDSSECGRPFWSSHVMIYPAGAAWPASTIDLQGPAW